MNSESLDMELGLKNPWMVPAKTIEPKCYIEEDIFRIESDRVLRSNWISVGRSDDIPEIGDFFTTELIDEPLILVRDSESSVKALQNACTHKWAKLVNCSKGSSKAFVCPNHAWTFGIDGSLKRTPHYNMADSDRNACSLHEFQCEVWEGWIFVNLDGSAGGLNSSMQELSQQIAPWKILEMKRAWSEPVVYEGKYNWKLVCENVGDAYHIVRTHQESLKNVDFRSSSWTGDPNRFFRTDFVAHQFERHGVFGEIEPSIPENYLGTWAYVLFPSHIFTLGPDFVMWQQIHFLSATSLRLEFHLLVPPDRKHELRAIEEVRQQVLRVAQEDQDAFCRIDEGLRGGSVKSGFLTQLEQGAILFQRWWTEQMNPTSGSDK